MISATNGCVRRGVWGSGSPFCFQKWSSALSLSLCFLGGVLAPKKFLSGGGGWGWSIDTGAGGVPDSFRSANAESAKMREWLWIRGAGCQQADAVVKSSIGRVSRMGRAGAGRRQSRAKGGRGACLGRLPRSGTTVDGAGVPFAKIAVVARIRGISISARQRGRDRGAWDRTLIAG